MGWWSGLPARLRLLFRGAAAESRMREEIDFHVEMEAERLARDEGLDPAEARRRALVAFGGVERTKEELREGRGLAWLSGLRLDVKLGARMLVKYPVLTGASVLGLAVAVALAVSFFEFMSNMSRPRLPLPDADRIVMVRLQDLENGGREPRVLHDFDVWRDELGTVRDLGAAATMEVVVRTAADRFVTLEGARVTPSMFPFARLQPIHGRPLRASDADPGSPDVAVLAHSAWRRLFDGDPSAIGRTVRVGSETVTVVGVMPEGFGFPVYQEIWLPLHDRAAALPREGPPLIVFGRLAPGASLEEAQAELDVLGRRLAEAQPVTHEYLRPRVERFSLFGDASVLAGLLNLPFLLFMVVVSANVATLLFARTASREGEIAMRTALGASRRRIVLQMAAEALVLTLSAAVVGLVVARWTFGRAVSVFVEVQQTRPPFWFDTTLSIRGVLYVLGLSVVAALIIGGLPALRATRGGLRHRLTSTGTGLSSMRFGALSTAVIVVQVAITVAFVPLAVSVAREALPERAAAGFPADRYLYGRLTSEHRSRQGASDGLGGDAEGVAAFDDVYRRLLDEPGVAAATRASWLPGFNHVTTPLEVEGDSTVVRRRVVEVDPNFFEVLGGRIVSGRGFRESDRASDAPVAIVDRGSVELLFGGENPIGRRIRFLPGAEGGSPGPWHRVVGVVDGMAPAIGPGQPVGLYRPLHPERHAALHVFARTDGRPDALVPRVHDLVEAVDPELGMAELKPLEAVWRPVRRGNTFAIAGMAVVAAVIVFFALMGIYALSAFTVERRAREIGIRTALGANPGRLLGAIFSRVILQIGLGVAAGAGLVGFALASEPGGLTLVAAVALAMLAVGALGAGVPALRALRIPPTEALRAE